MVLSPVRGYGAVYWHCMGAARKGERGLRVRERPRPAPRTAEVRERRMDILVVDSYKV